MMPKVRVPEAADIGDRAIILEGLVSFNDAAVGSSGYRKVAVLLCDDSSGATIGGIWGKIAYDWLLVELLFVPKQFRGSGLGEKLIREAEQIATDCGCIGIWLDTHGFQAPGFYRRLGYEVFGKLEDHPRGHTRFLFRKRL